MPPPPPQVTPVQGIPSNLGVRQAPSVKEEPIPNKRLRKEAEKSIASSSKEYLEISDEEEKSLAHGP